MLYFYNVQFKTKLALKSDQNDTQNKSIGKQIYLTELYKLQNLADDTRLLFFLFVFAILNIRKLYKHNSL